MDNTTKEYLSLISNKRKSVRTDNLTITSKISEDNKNWSDIEVSDISSGGVQFCSDKSFEKEAAVWLDLLIDPLILLRHNQLHIQAQGEVLASRHVQNNMSVYAAKFTNISPASETELDMLIQHMNDKFDSEKSH
ncbi:MAG: PilZ domain-containing protein [Defluviitaleaceae bacterium]|nr:PilZ domain-containing protein [Defluviitaleaceae bacterium]